jgi:hypothetical protein
LGLVGLYAECEDGVKKSDEGSRKIAELMKLAAQYGTTVKESSVGSIGCVGGVRRSTPERAEDGRDKSSEPTVN